PPLVTFPLILLSQSSIPVATATFLATKSTRMSFLAIDDDSSLPSSSMNSLSLAPSTRPRKSGVSSKLQNIGSEVSYILRISSLSFVSIALGTALTSETTRRFSSPSSSHPFLGGIGLGTRRRSLYEV